VEVGTLDSQDWFALTDLFSALQPNNTFYNPWAAAMSGVSQAYNFAYTDRFAHVVAPLDPARVDTLEIVLIGQVPEPSTYVMLGLGGARVFGVRMRAKHRLARKCT